MTVTLGGRIWVPCEVKPGPFPDERLVRVSSPGTNEWVGFVPVDALQKDIFEGSTFILGTIVDIKGDSISVYFPGHAVTRPEFQGSLSRIRSLGSVEAGHSALHR